MSAIRREPSRVFLVWLWLASVLVPVLASVGASACSERTPEAPRTPAPEPAPPSPAPEEAPPPDEPAPEDGCELDAPITWLEDAGDARSIALELQADGGLVVIAGEQGKLRSRALDGEGAARGDTHPLELPGVRGLVALARIGDETLLVARGSCAESADCLLARALDRDGQMLDELVSAALPAALRTHRRASADGRLYLAWSTEGGARGLDLFTWTNGRLGRARRPLGPEPASAELPTEILGLAADEGGRWAALWRRGAQEDTRSATYLTTDEAHQRVEALREALVVEAMEQHGREVVLVAGFEFSRPHLIRIAGGASEPLEAHELAASERLPAPFADRVRAELDIDARGLWLRRRDGAGDPIGAPTGVTEGRVAGATVSRVGERVWVAWIEGDRVLARSIRCDAR